MRRPKVLFVINYFWPDFVSTGQLMTELCTELSADMDVVVIAGHPDNAAHSAQRQPLFKRETYNGVQIVRLRLPKVDKRRRLSRLAYVVSYFVLALWAMLRERKVDVLYSISQPPILGGFLGTLGKLLKRARHVYNIQDFNPEQAEAVGYFKSSLVYGLARWLDTLSCRFADHVVVVGRDMAETLRSRFDGKKGLPSYSVINNWADEQALVPLPSDAPAVEAFRKRHQLDGKFVVMYSGNLGLYYDLTGLMHVCEQFRHQTDIVFAFVGEGAARSDLERIVAKQHLANVVFLPFQQKHDLVISLNAADVHWVVNQRGIKGVSVPSKLYGVMAVGKPVLGVLEQGSEAECLITESGCGLVAEPGDYGQVSRALDSLYACHTQRTLLDFGERGRAYLETHLTRVESIRKYRELLLSINH